MRQILIDTQIFQTLLYSYQCCRNGDQRMQVLRSIPAVVSILFLFLIYKFL